VLANECDEMACEITEEEGNARELNATAEGIEGQARALLAVRKPRCSSIELRLNPDACRLEAWFV